ncbi:hypothetical protein DFH06DRAFT_692784 [Mycena polygramma]|nr:hypothetical protein DFH06DRAFT_692784 [Mycena polygramma]
MSTPLDEYDCLPDPFAGVNDVDWAQLLSAPTAQNESSSSRRRSRSLSTEYFPDEGPLDQNYLAELERLDGTSTPSGSGSRVSTATAPRHSPVPTDRCLLNYSLPPTPVSPTPSSKGKKRSREVVEELDTPESSSQKKRRKDANLTGFEEELTCPICLDILVATHTFNPRASQQSVCGHSVCGECGWEWTVTKGKTECAVCRTRLASTAMIRNIATDNLVDKMLSLGDDADWKDKRTGVEERRKTRKWKDDHAARAVPRRRIAARA